MASNFSLALLSRDRTVLILIFNVKAIVHKVRVVKVVTHKVKLVVVTRAIVLTMVVAVVTRAIVQTMAVAVVIKAIVRIIIVLDKQAVVVEMFHKLLNKKKSIKKQFKIRSRKHKLNYLAKVVEVRA